MDTEVHFIGRVGFALRWRRGAGYLSIERLREGATVNALIVRVWPLVVGINLGATEGEAA
jgi:hypothetical protein